MRIVNLEGAYFVRALRDMGHEVLTVGQSESCDVRLDSPLDAGLLLRALGERGFAPDMILWCDLCRPPVVLGLESVPVLTAGYSIDQYCNPWHVPLSASFDLFFVAQKDYLPFFADPRMERRLEWLPLFCDPDHDADPGHARDIPVSFVGTLDPPLNPGRKKLLDGFRRLAPLAALTDDYRPVFARSRLVLNQTAVAELNFRIFQAMSCGAALLTETCANGFGELFTPGEDLYAFPRGDAPAAARIAREALEGGWREVAACGQAKVRQRHSTRARAQRILRLAEELRAAGGGRWRRENAAIVREETARAYSMLASDASVKLDRGLREHYAARVARLLRS